MFKLTYVTLFCVILRFSEGQKGVARGIVAVDMCFDDTNCKVYEKCVKKPNQPLVG